jgi:tetratricopeptide (TPR) repeat protein
LPLLAGAAALLPFLPALDAGFLNWDDAVMLVGETGWRGLGVTELRWMLGATVMGHWSPLGWVSFALDHAVAGLAPRAFHASNLALHGLNAALVCVVARRLLRPALAPRGGEPAVEAAALAAALLFAAHPLRAETVAWVSDRRDLLCATFVLLTVWAYLRRVAAEGRAARLWRVGSLLAFAAALASKGAAVGLPAVLLLLDWYPLRRVATLGWRRLAWEKAPYAALATGGAALTAAAVHASAAAAAYEAYPLSARLALAGYAFWVHPARFFWPAGLSPLYELPARVAPLAPRFLLPAVGALALTLLLLRLRGRWPAGLAAWAASVLLLLPVSGLVLVGRHVAADRYTYLSGLGLALLVGGGIVWAIAPRGPRVRRSAAVLGLATLVGLGALAWQQTRVWQDSETLWRRAVALDPGCGACLNNLARALMRPDAGRPRPAEAEAVLRRAIAARPDQPAPYRNLGAVLVLGGRWAEAEAVFAEVLRRWPISADGPAGMALAREGRGDTAGAVALLRLAVALEPEFTGARAELHRLERALQGRDAPRGGAR